jgi:hypothetical protein
MRIPLLLRHNPTLTRYNRQARRASRAPESENKQLRRLKFVRNFPAACLGSRGPDFRLQPALANALQNEVRHEEELDKGRRTFGISRLRIASFLRIIRE